MAREFYNSSRIEIHAADDFTGEARSFELNLNTFPFSSRGAADAHTTREAEDYLAEVGREMNTIWTLTSWAEFNTDTDKE